MRRFHAHTTGRTSAEWLFLAGFAITAFTTLMVRTTFYSVLMVPKDVFEPAAYALGALFLLAKVVADREASWRYALALGLVVLCGLSFWFAQAWRFSAIFLFVAAGKGVSLRRLAVVTLCIQLAVLAITVPFALTGRIESITVWRMIDGAWRPRLSYGYSHPNMLGQVFLTIACCFMVLRHPRFHLADIAAYALLGLAAALLVGARTATACIALVAIGALVASRVAGAPGPQRVLAACSLALFAGLCAFSLFMMVFYNPDIAWMQALDNALSTRFSLAHRFYEVFGPTAFGRDIMAVKVDDFLQMAPDNAYARAVLKQGVVPALALGALVFAALADAVRQSRFDACVLGLAVYAVGACMEMYAVNFTLNFFLIGCAWVLFGSRFDAPGKPPRGSHAQARQVAP